MTIVPMDERLIPNRPASGPRIGLLAGSGRFPLAFADAARRQGYRVIGVGAMGMASDELAQCCDYYTTTPIARLGRAIHVFKRARVTKAVMAGKIDKTV